MSGETEGIVAELLREAWAEPVRIQGTETLRDRKCFRVNLLDSPYESAIVKVERSEGQDTERFFDEWASLKFVNEAASGQGLIPRLFAGSRDERLMVFEDFGQNDSVATALMGDDPDRAAEALELHAEAVAEVHAATVGKETRYKSIRIGLAPRTSERDGMGWGDLRGLRTEMEVAFLSLGQSVAPAFWDEYEFLAGRIDDPTPFRTFVHNDSCPDNTILEPNRVRLIDWERGGFHTCFVDAAYSRLGMPHCWLAQKVPDAVVQGVERRYRQRLVRTIPEALDDRVFGQAMTEACAYWLVSNGTWRSLGDDFQWGASTWRQRVLMRLDTFARTTEEFSHLSEMGRAARETLHRLLSQWTVESMPLYNAFRSV